VHRGGVTTYAVKCNRGTLGRLRRFEVAFVRELPHGLCVAIELPSDDAVTPAALAALDPQERAIAEAMAPARRTTFVGGRLALREGLRRLGVTPGALLTTDRGGPRLPAGVVGSVSHKRTLAVALCATAAAGEQLGVDVELHDRLPRADIARYVLDEADAAALAALEGAERARAVLLRFSIKEAIYKALDPFVRRYVAFREVAVTPREDGSVGVRLGLAAPDDARRFAVEAGWHGLPGDAGGSAPGIVATARIRLHA
jgi:4'-phosphopantetheinyl transferase EntD